MLYSIKYEEHPGELKKVEEEQSQVNDKRLQEKLRKQSYNHDSYEVFEPSTKDIKDTKK